MNSLRILILSLGMQACASIGVTSIQSAPPKGENCDLAVFTDEREIRKSHEVVCFLDGMSAGHILADTTVAGVIRSARPSACQCGADALVIQDVRREGGSLWGRGYAILKAIRYTENKR